MSNKGFAFLESIIACSVMIIILVVFYIFSTNIITDMNNVKNYDNIADTYKLANIRTFIYKYSNSNTLNLELFSLVNNNECRSIKKLQFDKIEYTNKYKSLLKNMFGEVDKAHIYLCKFNDTLDDGLSSNSKLNGDEANKYFKYIKNKYKDTYRLILYNEDDNKYSSIKIWRIET